MIRSRKVPWKVLSLISIQNQWKPSGHQQPQRWGLCHVIGINTLRLRQNGCHFADNILKLIFLIACYASAFRRWRHYVFGLSVRPSIRPKPEIPSFDLYMGPLVHPTNRDRFTACPSVRPSVCPSGEVSGHLLENALREWPEILHADVSWPPSELISLWPWSIDFCNFGTILT